MEQIINRMFEWQHWPTKHPVYFVIFFIAMWLFVSFIFSRLTGWNKLSGKYRAQSIPKIKLMRAVQVSWDSLMLAGNIYTLGGSDNGLHLGVLFPFRFCHPPLFIPWQDIEAKRVKRLFMSRIQLSFGGDLSRPFEINEKVAEKLRESSNGQFGYQE